MNIPCRPHPKDWLFVAAMLCTGALRAEQAPDTVLWSDGRTWSGHVSLGGEGRLPLHDGRITRPIPMTDIDRIEWRVQTQRMERAWTFVEAGRTEKRYSGDPYPVRHWVTRVFLANGETLEGQLISTVIYLEGEDGATRVVVKSKQRGKPGEAYGSLVAPVELRFGRDEASRGTAANAAHVRVANAPVGLELGVVTLDPTQAAPVRRESDGRFATTLSGGRPVVLLRVGNQLRVGWTGDRTPTTDGATNLWHRLEGALPHVRDFFDERRILAIDRDPADPERCHSLMLLLREGKTTLGGPKPNPWHVEVWTWRLGEEGGILFEARAILIRDRRGRDEPPPEITFDEALAPRERWASEVDLVWSVGEGGAALSVER